MAASSSPAELSAALVMTPTALADWLVILPVVWCILIGAVLMMLRRRLRAQAVLAIPALGVLVVMNGALLARVAAGGPVTMVMGRWLPPFGIAFTVDLTGALFALTCGIVALAGAVAALDDIDDSGRRYGFHPFLLLLVAGVNGAFLTGDIFNLYVWFEVLLISSFGLLVLGSERGQIDGAVKYGFLNLIATTLFLIATGLLYGVFGTLNMADIALKAQLAPDRAPLITLTALFVLAFAMKAAAFPVNFWLPASYHTPRLVVSALFAGLLTKVGIYALLRVGTMLFPGALGHLSPVLSIVAGLTMLTGVFGALAQTDIRRLLGFLVVSGIGAMLAGVALGGPDGIGGAIFYALHSIVVMTALYLATGLAARLGGSHSLAVLGGLSRRHAGLAALSLMLFFSVSGMPPFSGFWPKVLLVRAALDAGAWWLAASLLTAGFLTMIATARIFLLAYWRPVPGATADEGQGDGAARLPAAVLWPVVALSALSLGAGLFPEPVLALIRAGAQTLIDPADYIRSVFPQGATP